ncbi:MAG: M23 family metallopeptidase [Propionibacteriaceae bacterium]|jgi:murein DD-endopeptidase MepM/ murein hydrolase activator NlpD|nr:M23 family metallopeptidase [Propionibacteriaceae bacterium]
MPSRPRRAVPSFAVFWHTAAGKVGAGIVAVTLVVAGLLSFVSLQSAGAGSAFADNNNAAAAAPSVGELAKQRQDAIAQDGAEIAKTSTETALANRQRQLADENQAILDEADRLEKLTEFLWPTDGALSPGNGYGMRYHPILHRYRLHDGIDISAKCNQPIYAAQSGTVIRVTSGYSGGSGNSAKIDHGKFNGDQVATSYLHMSKNLLKDGEQVEKGQLVGYVGSTGLSTGCHLHLSLYKNGKGTDPLEYLEQPTDGE